MPCVAALLGVAQVSDVMAVDGAHRFKRPIYAGNAIIEVTAPADQAVVATVRVASWPAAGEGGNAGIRAVEVDVALPTHTRFVGLAAGKSDRPDLQSAARAVSGGRGVGSEENFRIIYDFADKLGAAVGTCVRRSMPTTCPTNCRSARPARHRAGTVRSGRYFRRHPAPDRHQDGTIVAISKDGDADLRNRRHRPGR